MKMETALQPVDVFFKCVNASAYSFSLFIQSHLNRFGTLPGEEGLTDRFTYEYTLAASVRFLCLLFVVASNILHPLASVPPGK